MLSVFICYRREESQDVTGRMCDRLVYRFGRRCVFKDVDTIPPGRDFREHIDSAVTRCDAVLVVIGTRWLDLKGEGGKRRLDDHNDFVRVEIEAALRRDAVVVPVLLGDASVPRAEELPEPLRNLSYRQAVRLRPDPDFSIDMDKLIRSLEQIPQAGTRWNFLCSLFLIAGAGSNAFIIWQAMPVTSLRGVGGVVIAASLSVMEVFWGFVFLRRLFRPPEPNRRQRRLRGFFDLLVLFAVLEGSLHVGAQLVKSSAAFAAPAGGSSAVGAGGAALMTVVIPVVTAVFIFMSQRPSGARGFDG